MVEFREITETKEQRPIYPERHVWLPHLTTAQQGSSEHELWMRENWWMVNYSVFMDDKPEASRLAKLLADAFAENPQHPVIPDTITQLRKLRVKDHKDLTPQERWTRNGYQLVEYAGGPSVCRAIENRLNKYTGTILEAMCGHRSYFKESSDRTVTALDYCGISLERYPFPQRRRIECDLNQLKGAEKLHFFEDRTFDVISICFGFKYPEDIDALLREFSRILKPHGIVSFIENPHHGYEDLCRRKFDRGIVKILKSTGFKSIQFKVLHLSSSIWQKERGEFHHVQAIK
ncbi:MAG: methyltransferase domain-containing protein [Candidatus Pacebacteria bacterium]|nr:methyltransferase domain-containing protein [Candidatus Paceibacterota bacterium]